jgi:hypothetical protein
MPIHVTQMFCANIVSGSEILFYGGDNMKKWLLLFMVLSVLSVPALAYTVSGTVYYKGTKNGVPYANVSLSCYGTPATATADQYGSFSLSCPSDMSGTTMYLSASTSLLSGRRNWQVPANTYLETKNIEVDFSSAIVNPNAYMDTLVGIPVNPGEILSRLVITPIQPIQVQNAQINIIFNPPVIGVNLVQPAADVTITSQIVGPGALNVGIEVNPPRPINPDFPVDSFFDVFFEVDIPEPDAVLGRVTIDHAEVTFFPDGGIGPIIEEVPLSSTDTLLGEPAECKAHFLIDNEAEWLKPLEAEWPQAHISPMTPAEWNDPQWGYMRQWSEYFEEGDPYPPTEFLPAELHVYEGDNDPGNPNPDDAGLVMKWGDENTPTGEYASAWKYDYGLDPDLSHSTISITVTAPQFGAAGQINAVSFGIQDVNGNVRSWWWSCGPAPAAIAWNTPTTVTINTSQIGLSATTPPATGFANNPAFNLTMSQFFIVDENFQWVFGQVPVPPPGQTQFVGMWNYWHNLTVTPKLPGGGANSKWFVKYSQPPEEIEEGLINGWDEVSVYDPQTNYPIMADDWQCVDDRPVTDIHWWGSFKGWTQPHLPPILPSAFHIAVWTDVPAGVDKPYSHPGQLIWENRCTSWIWNFAGYDRDPRIDDVEWQENEACWQFAQFLSQDQWFRQAPMADGTPNIYWLSIAAIYPPGTDYAGPDFYPWGWKTRPHFFNDDAIRITGATMWPPAVGAMWSSGNPVEYPAGISWDLAFELTTNEPAYADNPIPGDIGGPSGPGPDGAVDLNDFVIMAENWLLTAPVP